MLAARTSKHDETPVGDQFVHLADVGWADYERLLELRGERRNPKLAYLDGVVELMTPSFDHENLRSLIGYLVEAWCLERGIEFRAFGAWTLKNKAKKGGVEPDQCYVFGVDPRRPKRPDLAIEVIWTSGGVDKRHIYRKLGVREVWYWRRGRIEAFALRKGRYRGITTSEVLPGIDLALLVTFLDRPVHSQAIREYRAALQKR
jgi:Uma2 family endonuclease